MASFWRISCREIIVGLEAVAEVAGKERVRRREEERLRAQEAARQAEERSRRKIDDNRWRQLRDLASIWEEVAVVRRLIGTLEGVAAADGEMSGEVTDWVSWAKARLDRIRTRSPAASRVSSPTCSASVNGATTTLTGAVVRRDGHPSTAASAFRRIGGGR